MEKTNRKKFKSRMTKFLLSSVSVLALTAGLSCLNKDIPAPAPALVQNEAVKDTVFDDFNPLLTTSYKTDTLYQSVSALLYYSNGEITRNWVEKNRSFMMQLPYFSHEFWHHHNKAIPYTYRYKYSPEQYIQLRMHEEISATLAAILTADLEYQAARDKQAVIKKYEKTYMGFYFNAIKNGEVAPDATDSLALNKKYSTLVNGTIDMWQKRYRNHYSPSLRRALKQYLTNIGLFEKSKKSYNMVLSHMYTFGGVDLSKYIEKDAYFPDNSVRLISEMAYVKSFTKSKEESAFLINEAQKNFPLLQYVDVNQQKTALQHLMIAAKLKYELQKLNKYRLSVNQSAITAAYNKVMYELSVDKSFYTFLDKCQFLGHSMYPMSPEKLGEPLFTFYNKPQLSEQDWQTIAPVYTMRKKNITEYIRDFDRNRLPINSEDWLNIRTLFMFHPDIDALIVKRPYSGEYPLLEKEPEILSDALSGETVSKTEIKPLKRRRLSDDIEIQILDFTQPILVLGNLPEKQRQDIVNYFLDFENIPRVFKECDSQAIEDYLKESGAEHPFGEKKKKTEPVQISKKESVERRGEKADTLAVLRNRRQFRSK